MKNREEIDYLFKKTADRTTLSEAEHAYRCGILDALLWVKYFEQKEPTTFENKFNTEEQ